ncbi:hypothetical protein N7517_000607 [Penicillium concentricum]|uniref:Apple domain-containing protein n=1 Tax=Penicillium concentricum TaxID=293559 RepID=A0A9W9SQB5_9EURO|nr:uncharacterized protein N7517_000607 [Penicillium concentricum]KAJ5382696.1 hypothetical protein N7517_000607 [Penicillium concentricum]
MASIRSILLVIALALQGSEALPECQGSVHNETIAYFYSAPMTFSYELATVLDCQNWCEKVPACQAWVYVDQSNQCDLHRTTALSVSDNAGFIFGGCKPSAVNESRLAPSPSPSLHSAVISTPAASEIASLAHARREIFRHKHKRYH